MIVCEAGWYVLIENKHIFSGYCPLRPLHKSCASKGTIERKNNWKSKRAIPQLRFTRNRIENYKVQLWWRSVEYSRQWSWTETIWKLHHSVTAPDKQFSFSSWSANKWICKEGKGRHHMMCLFKERVWLGGNEDEAFLAPNENIQQSLIWDVNAECVWKQEFRSIVQIRKELFENVFTLI